MALSESNSTDKPELIDESGQVCGGKITREASYVSR